jgi:hypothetical protein
MKNVFNGDANKEKFTKQKTKLKKKSQIAGQIKRYTNKSEISRYEVRKQDLI